MAKRSLPRNDVFSHPSWPQAAQPSVETRRVVGLGSAFPFGGTDAENDAFCDEAPTIALDHRISSTTSNPIDAPGGPADASGQARAAIPTGVRRRPKVATRVEPFEAGDESQPPAPSLTPMMLRPAATNADTPAYRAQPSPPVAASRHAHPWGDGPSLGVIAPGPAHYGSYPPMRMRMPSDVSVSESQGVDLPSQQSRVLRLIAPTRAHLMWLAMGTAFGLLVAFVGATVAYRVATESAPRELPSAVEPPGARATGSSSLRSGPQPTPGTPPLASEYMEGPSVVSPPMPHLPRDMQPGFIEPMPSSVRASTRTTGASDSDSARDQTSEYAAQQAPSPRGAAQVGASRVDSRDTQTRLTAPATARTSDSAPVPVPSPKTSPARASGSRARDILGAGLRP